MGGGAYHFLRAAGINTGAADVNARYLDGYGTATATSSSKVYISDGSGYLPDGSVDTGAILDGTVASGDLAGSINPSKITGTAWTASNDGSGSGLDADLLDGSQGTSYLWPTDISCGSGFTNAGTYCIQTNEAGSATWWAASDYCYDNYGGARLCSASEWYNACINSLLTNGTDDYEWVDDWNVSSGVLLFGNGSCSTVYYSVPSYSGAFRCCK